MEINPRPNSGAKQTQFSEISAILAANSGKNYLALKSS
jgi:hypothetical protein